VTEERWTAVDQYFTELFVHEDGPLAEAREAANQAGLPPISVSPTQGKLLHLLVRLSRARSVLEIGTLAGYSTIWMAKALPDGGRVVTLEVSPKHAAVAKSNIERAGLASAVEIIVGEALASLSRLGSDNRVPFDVVFIDADKPNYAQYLEWAVKLSHPGALIIADNVVRDGKVVDADDRDPTVQGARRFNESVAARSDLSATAIQTVGQKGYDGFAIMLVKAAEVGAP
jgi:predicted O-methyltransferase YrrM